MNRWATNNPEPHTDRKGIEMELKKMEMYGYDASMLNQVQSALCDAYDIRNSSDFKEIEHLPKDNEGTEFTLKDCIDDIVDTLERVETVIETVMEEEHGKK